MVSKKNNREEDCSPCQKGTNDLMLGAGVGIYGTATFIVTGSICPACIVIAPALLGLGTLKRIRFQQRQKNNSEEI